MRGVELGGCAAASSTSPRRELGLDQHAEQRGGTHPVVAHEPQPAAGAAPGQVEVAAGEVEPRGRQQRLHVVVAAEQQCLGLGEPALAGCAARPARSAGARRCPASTCLEVGVGPGQHALGLAPPTELAQQDPLDAARSGC